MMRIAGMAITMPTIAPERNFVVRILEQSQKVALGDKPGKMTYQFRERPVC